MISIHIDFSQRGKTLIRLNKDLELELEKAVNDGLELTRRIMREEAPSSKYKGSKYSKNRIINFLRAPSRCIRKISKLNGYVFLDERILLHLKYVIQKTRSHIISGNPILYFWWLKSRTWFIGSIVHHPGTSADNFIFRTYLRIPGPIYNSTYRHLIKAIRK